jgi:hypothetical protein
VQFTPFVLSNYSGVQFTQYDETSFPFSPNSLASNFLPALTIRTAIASGVQYSNPCVAIRMAELTLLRSLPLKGLRPRALFKVFCM